jgi:putative ABC transport system permease protein
MFLQELRHALRGVYKRRTFSTIIIVVLALGIGANTAIFSVVNAVLLRPLPFEGADQLVQIWHVPPAKSFPGMTKFAVSPANFLDWQAENHVFESMSVFRDRTFTLSGSSEPQTMPGEEVGPEFFSVLKVKAIYGRVFSREDSSGPTRIAVVSEAFWRNQLDGSRNSIGQTLRLNDEPFTIVGVIPATATFPPQAPAPQVWTCLQWDAKERAVRGNHNYLAIGRLKPGTSVAQANSELSSMSRQLELVYPAEDAGWGATAVALRDELVGQVRPALLVLLGAVAFVLLISCTNVMNLVLATTLARRKELAIRTALGANRAHLVRQVLLETVLLALCGGVAGILVAEIGVKLIVNFLGDELPRIHVIGIDATVLLFTLVLSIMAGVLAGLLPAWHFATAEVNDALKHGDARTDSDSGRRGTRNVLVVIEFALSLMLLVGAGLMIRTFYHLQHLDIGIDPHNVLTASVSLPKVKYDKPQLQRGFFNQALERIRSSPGVESASIVDSLPVSTDGSTQPILIEGRPVVQMADQPEVAVRNIGTGYLRTMRIPLIRGRDFADKDSAGSEPVLVITQSLAREFFPNEDPIGRHITLELTDKGLGLPATPREIIGIVGDARLASIESDNSKSAVYVPFEQLSYGQMTFAIRAKNNAPAIASSVADVIHSLDPSLAVMSVMTMDEVVRLALAQRRFNMLLLVAFAGLALVLAGVGMYGVLSYTVRRRVREIGIRMTLGAQITDIVRMVVVDGLRPAVIGVGIGLVGTLALGRVFASVIYGVSARDSLTFAIVCSLLLGVALVASISPAYRAARVEPVRTLRDE